jgi:hypothetical protein
MVGLFRCRRRRPVCDCRWPAAIASVLLTMAFMLSTITTANTQPKYLPRGLEPADHVIQPVPIRGPDAQVP